MASRPKQPTPRPAPRLYLITPRLEDTSAFSSQLAAALDGGDVAAVLLRLADADERTLINSTKSMLEPVQDKGVALLLDGHAELVARAGADGAHLTGIAAFTDALEQLKPERIAGAGGLASRHDAMLAAERGADYVMFGEPDAIGGRPTFAAIEERVAWWAEVFEIPCVGYAASMNDVAPLVAAGADFIALGDYLWRDPHAITAVMGEITCCLQLPEPAA
ncbi:MAG TPA: thiamine phosphate synthase [Pseudolabrys sp.]|nr:thiamine phosphate synthase [Pseudolabrys sp.]